MLDNGNEPDFNAYVPKPVIILKNEDTFRVREKIIILVIIWLVLGVFCIPFFWGFIINVK